MTFNEILADIYRRTSYTTSPPSDVTTRIKAMVNQTHRSLLSHPTLQSLRDDTITFDSTSGTVRYGLPPNIALVQTITERTNRIRLVQMSLDELRYIDPGLTSSGTSTRYVLHGIQAVAVQPSAAAEIFVKSTSASDTGTAYMEAVRTGGYRVSLSVTMTGTTGVTLGAAYTDIVEVTKFYLSTAAVGTVTLRQTSGSGTVLATIPIGYEFSRYQGIQLWPTPTATITYYVDYMRTIPDLVNNTDEPLLPEDFHWMLSEGAMVHELRNHDDDTRRDAMAAYDRGLSNLLYRVGSPPDFLPSRGSVQQEMSRVGSNFKGGAGIL